MGDVARGLLCVHALDAVAQCDALVEGCVRPEPDASAQGRLPEQQAPEGGPAVHVGGEQETYLLELGRLEQVGLIEDDEETAPSSSSCWASREAAWAMRDAFW